MYRIIDSNGNFIGITNTLKYIRYDAQAKMIFPTPIAEMANGILIGGEPYNINEEYIPHRPIVTILNMDDDEYIYSTYNKLQENINDISFLQNLIMYQDNEMSSIEDALMELDNQMAEEEN